MRASSAAICCTRGLWRAPSKFRAEPRLDDLHREFDRDEPLAEGDDVRVVVLPREPGSLDAPAQRAADDLIARYGEDAVGALRVCSRRSAQRLNMLAEDGVLSATQRSAELLPVIRKYGDEAMDFIWQNKGALVAASVLASFLADPQPYLAGAKGLVVDPLLGPVAQGINGTLILSGILVVVFLPFLARSIIKAARTFKPRNPSS